MLLSYTIVQYAVNLMMEDQWLHVMLVKTCGFIGKYDLTASGKELDFCKCIYLAERL